jgi:replicative DNA helicase
MEEAVLASIIKDPALFPVLKDLINIEDFYWIPHKWVWSSFVNLYDSGRNIDMLTTVDEMEKSGSLENYTSAVGGLKGITALNKLRDLEIDTNHAESYASVVKDDSARRKIIEVMNRGTKWAIDGSPSIRILTNIEQELGRIASNSGTKSTAITTASEAANMAKEAIDRARNGNGVEIKSGLIDLDELIGGFFPGDLIFFAGRAGEGKSGALLTVASNVAINNKYNKKVSIFSMEMSTVDLVNRLISQYTNIPTNKLRKGDIKDSELDSYYKALEKISKAPIQFDDSSSLSIPEMRTKIRKMKELGTDMIIVDQLNLMNAQMHGAKEFEKINWLAYRLKEMAREFSVPILVAHQMNRSIEQKGMAQRDPQLSDLEQAGEKAADVVIMIRHKKESNVIKESFLHIVKQRNGATGVIPVTFLSSRIKFENAVHHMPDFMQGD